MSKDTVTVVPPSYPALENEIYRSMEPVTERQTDLDGWYAEELNLGLYPESPSPNGESSLDGHWQDNAAIREAQQYLSPSPNVADDVDAELAREDLDNQIFLKDLVSELAPAFTCSSCDDQGCGFCVPNEPFDSNCRYGD